MLTTRYLPLFVLPTVALAGHASAQRIEPGVQYRGQTTLEAPEYGATFILPAGWAGVLPPDAEFFVMQSTTYQGYIFAGIDELTLSEARARMSGEIDVGDVVLRPAGEVRVEGSALTADYAISGSQMPLLGRVTTLVGDHGYGIFLIATATTEHIEPLREVVGKVIRSVRLSKPVSVATSAGTTGDWTEQLSGRKLSYFFTRTGYTEGDYLWLCANGRFFRSSNSGGFGGGASGAFESKNGGRWEASGGGNGGTLTLIYNDGSTARFTLTIREERLFLDESRYFREATDCR